MTCANQKFCSSTTSSTSSCIHRWILIDDVSNRKNDEEGLSIVSMSCINCIISIEMAKAADKKDAKCKCGGRVVCCDGCALMTDSIRCWLGFGWLLRKTAAPAPVGGQFTTNTGSHAPPLVGGVLEPSIAAVLMLDSEGTCDAFVRGVQRSY